MGFSNIEQCIFTGEPAQAIIDGRDAVEYYVIINNKRHLIRYSTFFQKDDEFFIKNKNVFYALLYNNNWFEHENIFITIENLKALIVEKNILQSPKEKMDRLFLTLFSFQKEDGEIKELETDFYHNILWKILYFKSFEELNYYVKTLHKQGLIDATFTEPNFQQRSELYQYQITFEGLNHHIQLITEGENSTKCFIAMSFRKETEAIRSSIKKALKETGFEPLIVDEENIDSDKTINDKIIANLKRCKFCIADFTYHSKGVYFESGHALGQGKKVIYTCRKDEFENAHFDIRPLQHIIYEDIDELTEALINKIDAWIK